jgi:bifunctional DNase/RNase
MREMSVYGVSFDIVGKQPIVLLKTQDENKYLPIWIGHPEAAAILMKLQESTPARPLTHDLLTSMLEQLETEVVKITVTELRENTFFAQITLRQNGQEIEVDSRPSDAIAIAVRAGAKIFATDEVIEESGIVFEGQDEENEQRIARVSALADLDPAEFRRFLDEVTAEDFAQVEEDEPDDRQ